VRTTLYNGQVITPLVVRRGGVVVEDGSILRVFEGDDFERTGELIDCRGHYISPGFVDIHTHGIFNGDTMDATPEALHRITRLHAQHGTTSLLPTTLSRGHDEILRALNNICVCIKLPPDGARILGAHLEGNYFSPRMAGAQNPAYLYPPDEQDYMEYVKTGCVVRVAAAPELPGALKLAEQLVPLGIQLSIGHSNGTPEDVRNAIAVGYSSLTHIFNAQSALTSVFVYPEAGVCETALLYDELRVECICDGNHLSPTLLKLIYKIKGADGMIGITDAVYAGAADGDYNMGGLEVEVKNNICILKNQSAFAGSIATMDLCVRTLHLKAGIPIQDAVSICSYTPAKVIGRQNSIGMLHTGFDADINVFDSEINILYTMVQGKTFQNNLADA
jgi:N-acetylglucosamine-6-phosphate deacetylase